MARLFVLVSALCASASWAYHTGAPDICCDSMTPNHGFSAQTSDPLLKYSIVASKADYLPGDVINVAISAMPGSTFKGFFLQMRNSSGGTQRFGTWNIGADIGRTACGVGGATHNNNTVKTFVSMQWTAPASSVGDLHLLATIVAMKSEFWLAVSGPLVRASPCTQNPCVNGGTCSSDGRCQCRGGFTGADCSAIDSCYSSPCVNGATCFRFGSAYSCQCPKGFTGVNCQTVLQCLLKQNPNIVATQCPAFSSSDFQLVAAANLVALCDRARPYILCAQNVTLNCDASLTQPIWGQTFTYFVACCLKSGLTTSCPVRPTTCVANPCQNSGTCRDTSNGYTCTCVPGYNGNRCENDINECASFPCSSVATCENLVNGYRCRCPPGYNGTNCGNRYFTCTAPGLLADPAECDWFFQCSAKDAMPLRGQCANVAGLIQLRFDTKTSACLAPSLFSLNLGYATYPGCKVH